MTINILLSTAQEESRAKSEAVKFGIRKAQEQGKFTSSAPYGYKAENGFLIPIEEELKRVIPVVERLSKTISVPISVDTYKAQVAKEAINAGAHLINDVWGLKKDKKMAQTLAELGVPVILMHNREESIYHSLIDDIIADLRESITIALKAGIDEKRIIIDPGIGFAKSYEENLHVMNRLDEIVSLGYPVLLGTSRKSIVGNTLNLPANERIEGTIATVCYGITKGCKLVRVHDIKEIKKACKMIDKMIYLENKEGYHG